MLQVCDYANDTTYCESLNFNVKVYGELRNHVSLPFSLVLNQEWILSYFFHFSSNLVLDKWNWQDRKNYLFIICLYVQMKQKMSCLKKYVKHLISGFCGIFSSISSLIISTTKVLKESPIISRSLEIQVMFWNGFYDRVNIVFA